MSILRAGMGKARPQVEKGFRKAGEQPARPVTGHTPTGPQSG